MTETWGRAGVLTVVTLRQEPGAPVLDLEEVRRWLRQAAIDAILDDTPWPLEAAVAVELPDETSLLDLYRSVDALSSERRAEVWGDGADQVTTVFAVPTLVVFPPGDAGPLYDEAQLYAHEAVCSLEPKLPWQVEWRTTSVPLEPSLLAGLLASVYPWVASEGFMARFGEPS